MSRKATRSPLTAKQLEDLRVAVYLAGGAAKVARRMGYKTAESVRRFTQGLKPVPAERVEQFREAVDFRLTAAQVRPDLHRAFAADAPKASKRVSAA